jgi:hypothetical protein
MVIDGCNRQDHDVLLCCYPFTDSVNGYSIREWGGTVATRSGEQTQLRKIIRFAAGGAFANREVDHWQSRSALLPDNFFATFPLLPVVRSLACRVM